MNTFKGNNRVTTQINDETHYILHETSIVIKSSEGIKLNNGGWMTATTKKALNEVGAFLNFNVYQKKGAWFVEYKGKTLNYENNMILA